MGSKTAGVVEAVRAIATHFDVSVRTIENWRKRLDPMPFNEETGEHDIAEITRWREMTFTKDKRQRPIDIEGNEKGQSASEMHQLRLDLQRTKLRKDDSLARQAEIKAQRMDDEFVAISTLSEWVGEFLIQQRNMWTSLPMEMFASAPDEIKQIYMPDLQARIDINLNRSGDWIERVEIFEVRSDSKRVSQADSH